MASSSGHQETRRDEAVTGASSTNRAVLLYDGACPFCRRSVALLGRLDRQQRLQMSPRQDALGQAATGRHPELASVNSMILLLPTANGERVITHSNAVLRAVVQTGGLGQLARIFLLIPASWRDVVYRFIANRRHRWCRDGCAIPAKD